jgi:uncharacterized membrane protein YGL010W
MGSLLVGARYNYGMKSLEMQLTQYAAYHRDQRNIATHFVGVPMIVFAVVQALAAVSITVNTDSGSFAITAAAISSVAACVYYFRLDFVFGVTMAVTLFAMCAASSEIIARLGGTAALGLAAALFVVGWVIQFVGHRYEGMKPAFFDDAKQLLIGPVFVWAEAFFLAGARPHLRRHIEERVGPTVPRRDGRPLPLEKPGTDPHFQE